MTEVRQQLALANAQELVSKMNDKWCVRVSFVATSPCLPWDARGEQGSRRGQEDGYCAGEGTSADEDQRSFARCITKPGTALSSADEGCITRCTDRFLEACTFSPSSCLPPTLTCVPHLSTLPFALLPSSPPPLLVSPFRTTQSTSSQEHTSHACRRSGTASSEEWAARDSIELAPRTR